MTVDLSALALDELMARIDNDRPIILAAAVCWAVLRVWKRRRARPARAPIPFGGRLTLTAWLATRVIEACEGVLRRQNVRRRP